MAGDLCSHPPDPADVRLAICLAEGEPLAEVSAYDVTVKAGHSVAAIFKDQIVQGPRQCRLAAARKAREEDHEPTLIGLWLVLGKHLRHRFWQLTDSGEAQHLPAAKAATTS